MFARDRGLIGTPAGPWYAITRLPNLGEEIVVRGVGPFSRKFAVVVYDGTGQSFFTAQAIKEWLRIPAPED